MIVFKTFLKVLNKCKGMILLYTIILLVFAGFNMSNSESSMEFSSEKPDVALLIEDECIGLTKNLVDYIKENSNLKEIEEEKLKDALFYRDVNMIIKIPKNYRMDVLEGKNPEIEIQSTGDYQASLEKMLLEKYLRVQNIYQSTWQEEDILIEKINETISKKITTSMTSTLDNNALSKAKFYYNFSNYTLLAGLVYVICLILSIFKSPKIMKRITVSSMNYKTENRLLFFANSLFALTLWLFYVLFSFLLVGSVMFSIHGVLFMINSLLFSFCALGIAFLIGNLIQNKDAISGIVNVVALGSSFLCGAFVPVEFLPESILKIAHIFPSYWFINANEMISTLEHLDHVTIKPLMINFLVLLLFTIGFGILTNIVSKRKLRQ